MMKSSLDPQFPQIPFALDLAFMQETLQQALFAQTDRLDSPLVIETCQIDEQLYKPGKSCVLSYRLQLLNTETGSAQEQIVYTRLCKAGEGLPEFEQARAKNLFISEGVKPLIYLREAEMVIWSFPNDRTLTHLPKMLDHAFLHDRLPQRLVSLDLHRSNRMRTVNAEVIHYMPERSCMIRYQLGLESQKTGQVSPVTIYGKIYRDESGSEVYRIMKQLSEHAKTLVSAKPLGYDPELKVLWQLELPGRPFSWGEIKVPHSLEVIERIAGCLAAFHGSSVRSKRQFKLEDILLRLNLTADIAEKTHPHLKERIRSLVHTLFMKSETIDFSHLPITPIHRDLKMTNFLIDYAKVGLIDMDSVRMGDPLSDIGSFVASFYSKGVVMGSDEGRIREIVDLFRRSYSGKVEWEVSEKRLNWYIAASFIYESTRRSIRQWDAKKMENIRRYLDLSEHYVFHDHG